MLGVAQPRKLHLRTLDVSTAFMYAPIKAESCDLVMLPSNLTTWSRRGRRTVQKVICKLLKGKNGLRRAPLLWFQELLRRVNSLHKGTGTTQTFEPTLFRLELQPGALILFLVYVCCWPHLPRTTTGSSTQRKSLSCQPTYHQKTHLHDIRYQGMNAINGTHHLPPDTRSRATNVIKPSTPDIPGRRKSHRSIKFTTPPRRRTFKQVGIARATCKFDAKT